MSYLKSLTSQEAEENFEKNKGNTIPSDYKKKSPDKNAEALQKQGKLSFIGCL